MVIYIDILLVINIYINYFLIKITSCILHIKTKTARVVSASFISGLMAFVIFLPQLSLPTQLIIKLLGATIIIFISFGKNKMSKIIKYTLFYFSVNCLLAGVINWISQIDCMNKLLTSKNMIPYSQISVTMLIITTLLVYFVISIAERFFVVHNETFDSYTVYIYHGKEIIKLKGFADSGNTLIDCFSGKPVVVADSNVLSPVLDLPNTESSLDTVSIYGSNLRGFRLLPYNTCSGKGIMPVFSPDKIIISDDKNGNKKSVDALVGISNKVKKAVFNPKLLI